MSASRTPAPRLRSTARRILGTGAVVAAAAAIAAGCGSGGSSGDDAVAGVTGGDGALSWLPRDTWLVASADVSADTIDEAVNTLGRLPIWSLAEGFLPASSGKGLRKRGFEEIAKSANKDEKTHGKLTAKQLEAAFGDRAGLAITDNDFSKFDGDHPPVAGWIDVDDKDAAHDVLADLAEGKLTKHSRKGVDYYTDKSGDGAFAIEDDLMVIAADKAGLERLIDVHDGDDSIADDETGSAVIDASIGHNAFGFAVATKPVLDAVPDLVREDKSATITDEQLDQLGKVLSSGAVDELVPNWIGGSATIDDTGLRFRGTWSNPRDLASPKVGARELAERMPASAPIVQAGSSDGSGIGRVQDAWAEVSDAYDIKLDELGADCAPDEKWACDLGVELLRTVLEDEDLAKASEDADDASYAIVEDLAPLLGMAASSGAGTTPAPIKDRIFEVTTSGRLDAGGYTPPAELKAAAVKAGIILTSNADGTSVALKLRAGSPAAVALKGALTPQAVAGMKAVGIDVAALLSPAGLTISAEEADGLLVAGFPPNAPSKVVPALNGDADTLGDSDTYHSVVKAAKPPKEVGQYGYIDLGAYVEAIFTAISKDSPQAARALPTVRNNLADVPGVLTWTTRETFDGHEVGVAETVVPILK